MLSMYSYSKIFRYKVFRFLYLTEINSTAGLKEDQLQSREQLKELAEAGNTLQLSNPRLENYLVGKLIVMF